MINIAGDEAGVAVCLALRRRVFIEEQGIAEHDEIDGEDEHCSHVLARQNGVPKGAARLRKLGNFLKIQRVCVLPEARGHGIGGLIIQYICDLARTDGDVDEVRLGAQLQAMQFYRRLGFSELGEIYLDAGIEHKDMRLDLNKCRKDLSRPR